MRHFGNKFDSAKDLSWAREGETVDFYRVLRVESKVKKDHEDWRILEAIVPRA